MKDVDIIDNYKDLPLGVYEKIVKICLDDSDDSVLQQVKIISLLAGRSEDEILNLPIAEYSRYASRLTFLENVTPADAGDVKKAYKIGPFELVPVTDIRKVTTAQYIDFQECVKDLDNKLVEVLSCLMVPKGMSYGDGYDLADVQQAIRDNMSVADAIALSAFFFNSYRQLIRHMLIFSKRQAKGLKKSEDKERVMAMIAEAERHLNNAGDGLRA